MSLSRGPAVFDKPVSAYDNYDHDIYKLLMKDLDDKVGPIINPNAPIKVYKSQHHKKYTEELKQRRYQNEMKMNR